MHFLAVVCTIYFSRGLLFPIVLALLLTCLLAPVVRLLSKLRIPRMIGSALAIAVLLTVAGTLFSRLAAPATGQIERAP